MEDITLSESAKAFAIKKVLNNVDKEENSNWHKYLNSLWDDIDEQV